MNINLIWDSSVSNMASGQQAAFKAAVTYAADFFDNLLNVPYTVSINVGWGEITQGSKTTALPTTEAEGGPDDLYDGFSYAQVLAALKAHATTPATMAACNALPTTDPTNGAGIELTVEQIEALGLTVPANAPSVSGSIGFGAATNYNFSTVNRAISGEADFVGIAEHELAHALGRIAIVGSGDGMALLDLFRYTAPGTLATSTSQTAYFSIDGGVTPLRYFYTGDPADWTISGSDVSKTDAFDAFYGTGTTDAVSAIDVDVMNLIGFPLSTTGNYANSTVANDLKGDGRSDLVLENTSGQLVAGEIGGSGQLGYQAVAAIGSEWQVEGVGNYLSGVGAEMLFHSTASGALSLGQYVNGSMSFTGIGAIGSEWQFDGTGDFIGNSAADFLLRNANSGALVVGAVSNGSASYTQIGGLGPEWQFEGTGNLLGDGTDGFLLHNTNTGALVVGEVSNGSANFTTVGGVGNEWQFEGTADFLAKGQDEFLMHNSNTGALVIGTAGLGSVTFTQIGGIGNEWQFLGTGNYTGTGAGSFMLEDNGALVLGSVSSNKASFTQVGDVGTEWSSKTSSPVIG